MKIMTGFIKIKTKFIKIFGIFLAAIILPGCGNTTADNDNRKQEIETSGSESRGDVKEPDTDPFSNVPQELDKMPSFTAKDLNGNTVTDSIFQEKDLTVVNIWGTFCGPCIEEMPELAGWSKSMPSNVQIIGLVCDIEGEEDQTRKDKAVEIMEKAEAGFTRVNGKISVTLD